MDFSFFFDPPELTAGGLLTIEALAPLSMASGQPGSYYQSMRTPSSSMLYGMLENALGWHIGSGSAKDPHCREAIWKNLQKAAKKTNKSAAKTPWLSKPPEPSESKYFSFLQYHLEFDPPVFEPSMLTYDDLWSQSLRDSGRSFFGGSRHYDERLESTINKVKAKEMEFGDRAGFSDVTEEDLAQLPSGAKVKYNSIRPRFPQYYASPKIREYIVPESPYLFSFRCTGKVFDLITAAAADPAAPLYLGSNDGWVEVKIEKS